MKKLQQKELVKLLGELVDAMNSSVDIGSTDHLDCCMDGGKFWYRPLEKAEKFLAKIKEAE